MFWRWLFIGAWTAGSLIVDAVTLKRQRLHDAWCRTARDCGLTDVQDPRGHGSELVGRSGELLVRFELTRTITMATRIVISDERHDDRTQGLRLRREDLSTAARKRMGVRELELGDVEFDEVAYIEGPNTLARAVLDVATRPLVRAFLAELGIRRRRGLEWLKTTEAAFEAGQLRVTIEASSPSELAERLREILPALLDTAQRLRGPDDVAARLAETAGLEPLPGARLQDLLTLAREFPEHASTRPALRAGLKDEVEEIRLRCAMALEEEGRGVLLALARDPRADPACAARAIATLHDHLPLEQAEAILSQARRARRSQVAAAALESLGHRRLPETIPTIARILRQERGALAVAAARALAAVGLPAAEPPLIEALDREDARVAAAEALGRVGSVAAVLPLKEAMARHDDPELHRAARQAVAEILARRPGATPGQLSLADAESQKAGQLTLADEAGRLSLTDPGLARRSGPSS